MNEAELDCFYAVFSDTKKVTLAAMMDHLCDGKKVIVLSEMAMKGWEPDR